MRALTDRQLEGIDALVSARRIEKVLPDQKRSKAFLNAAHERLSQPVVRLSHIWAWRP